MIKRLFRRRVFCTVASTDILHAFLKRELGSAVVFVCSRYADLISWIGEGMMRACSVFAIEIEGEERVLFGADQCTEKPRSEEAACIGLLIGRGGFRSVKAGSDIHRDGAQLRDGVGLCEGELTIMGVDRRARRRADSSAVWCRSMEAARKRVDHSGTEARCSDS